MAKPKKLPSGSYRIRLYLGKDSTGKLLYKSITAPTSAECKALADDYQRAHRKPSGTTLEGALRLFMEQSRPTLAPGTIRGHAAYFRAWERFPRLMSMRSDDVRASDIQQAINEMILEKTPKGTPISPKTIRERYHFLSKALRKQGYVCNLHPNALTARHNRFLRKHGFPHSRFHDYRHHMASALHAAGIPDQYIMQRLGHSGDSTLKRVYRHTLADHEREMVNATLEHFERFRP